MSASSSDKQDGSIFQGPEGLTLVLGKHFHVFPEQPLPHLDSPNAQAFAARDRRSPDRAMFALLCSRQFAPRTEVLRAMHRIEGPPVLKPNAWEVIHWPPTGQDRFVIVLDQPGGMRLADNPEGRRAPIREDELYRVFMRPLLSVLRDLRARALPHRAIRADNIFFASEARDQIVIGECVSEPSAISQPAFYEPVPNAQAQPMGRGGGTVADDMYNVGVLILSLLNGGNPCADMTPEELLQSKIEIGSYATFITRAKVPLSLMEPLRGMLTDNPLDRWTVDDFEGWMNGRAQSPKPPPRPLRTARAYNFLGEDFTDARLLAHEMARNWDAAREAVLTEDFFTWLQKGYSGTVEGDAFVRQAHAVIVGAGKGADPEDRILANLLILLDPSAPIRYRSIAINPDALGQALSASLDDEQYLQDFMGLIRAKLPIAWLQAHPFARPEFVAVRRSIELIEQCLEEPGWGYGIERALYELNKGHPCQSPILDRFMVHQVNQLLPALEAIAGDEPPPEPPIDRHIAAFCAAAIRPVPKRVLAELSRPIDSAECRLGMLRLLDLVQEESLGRVYPKVARWMLRSLSPAIEAFHHRPHRAQLGEQLKGLAEKGRFRPMVSLADNPALRARDSHGFERAKALYARNRKEIAWLKDGGALESDHLTRGSRQASVLVSSVLSGLALVIITATAVL